MIRSFPYSTLFFFSMTAFSWAAPTSKPVSLMKQGTNIVAKHCGSCHLPTTSGAQKTMALKVFDLTSKHWWKGLKVKQLQSLLWIFEESPKFSKREQSTIRRFVMKAKKEALQRKNPRTKKDRNSLPTSQPNKDKTSPRK